MNTQNPTPDATDTPRTDAAKLPLTKKWWSEDEHAVHADFARTLERELTSAQAALIAAKAEVERLKEETVWGFYEEETPQYGQGSKFAHEICSPITADEANAMVKTITELRAWKESALAVEREWDPHALTRLLGAQMGDSVRKVIAERVPRLAGLLRVARCPDPNCAQQGTTWHIDSSGAGEPEQVPQQCQWCCERAALAAPAEAQLSVPKP